MKKFIQKSALFICIFIGAITCFTVFFILKNKLSAKDIPALNFSESYSFNDKMNFLHDHPKDAAILAIGSSMTLNNLYSETVVKELGSDKYFNTASWGQSIGDSYTVLKSLHKFYPIKKIIIVSNIVDFKESNKKIDTELLEDCLGNTTRIPLSMYFANFSLKYYLTNSVYAKKVKTPVHQYESLNYDKNGGISLFRDGFTIDSARWNNDYTGRPFKESQYAFLDSILNYCSSNNIQLIFFQSPLRQGLQSKLDSSVILANKVHVARIAGMIQNKKGIFADANGREWPDSLYADGTHFNEIGAEEFTRYCFDKMKGQLPR